jgi:hypothetical protein
VIHALAGLGFVAIHAGDFDRAERAVADGGRLSPEEAIAYASRGRGERRRPPERSADVPEAGGAQTEPCNRYREAGP